ncbi:MAG TPA: hypothetical protein P5069_05330 [Candidatus Hydrogenedentes bacterium]|nr:hypothetical protein [Candidatus Hydrogenedentota bacterium]HOH50697.1 hypothetical protein [Candidatus Hydrogenedentota bacterium]HRZ81862.1 hypothetical protein [Candidatus Hydrogenedentota bacterium]
MKWQRITTWTLFIVCVVSVGVGAYRAREAVAAWFGGPLFLFGMLFVPTVLTLLALGARKDYTRRGALIVLVLVTPLCFLVSGLSEQSRLPHLYTPPLMMFFLLACFLVLNTLDQAESFVKERRARRKEGVSDGNGDAGTG